MPAIETAKLVKNYRGVQALKGVSLTVQRGEIFGLLGQNGAGKTTLIKILLGITKRSGGEATLLDEAVGTTAVRRKAGYLPEDHHFPGYHTGVSLLDFYGALLGVPAKERRVRIPHYLDMVGLRKRMHYKIRTYSKGMKQRLGVAQALMHQPEIIFLDEPTDGVDPIGRREIREMLLRLKDEGKTIFLNSHLLGEIELICDRVGILAQGELIREGSVAALTHTEGLYDIGLAEGEELPVADLRRLGFGIGRNGSVWTVRIPVGTTIDPVVGLLHQRGLKLRHLTEKHITLEEMFLATVQDALPSLDAGNETAPLLEVLPADDRIQKASAD